LTDDIVAGRQEGIKQRTVVQEDDAIIVIEGGEVEKLTRLSLE
jgi:hypothetical protein